MAGSTKVVLDTDVVVAAMLSAQGASRVILRRIVDRSIATVISVPLMLEYEAVLKRPGHMTAGNYSTEDADVVLDQLASCMEHVEMFYLWRAMLSDAEDDMVLETAVNGNANAIVTFNARDFGKVPASFGIRVLRPGELLRRLR